MKFFYTFVILFFLNNCSFDNKSGIWKNENSISNNEDTNIFKDFKKISSSREQYAENISIKPARNQYNPYRITDSAIISYIFKQFLYYGLRF